MTVTKEKIARLARALFPRYGLHDVGSLVATITKNHNRDGKAVIFRPEGRWAWFAASGSTGVSADRVTLAFPADYRRTAEQSREDLYRQLEDATLSVMSEAEMEAAMQSKSSPRVKSCPGPQHHATKKTPAQLDHEITHLLAGAALPGSTDVTEFLLRDSSVGPGDLPRLVATARPAEGITTTLAATLSNLHANHDRSMGFISKPLAYSRAMPHSKREHANLIRLIKGGFVHVCEVGSPPPPDSTARRDSPYGDRYYVLHVGSCGG